MGGVAKDVEEVKEGINNEVASFELKGNYRSSQRIIDYYKAFQVNNLEIEATGRFKDEQGRIVHNTIVDKSQIEIHISQVINHYINEEVIRENEICVLAPAWWLVAPIGRKLKQLLPDCSFDATGLSPFRRNKDNFWYRVTRLFLIQPSPNMYVVRYRWARELIDELKFAVKGTIPEEYDHPKRMLRLINSISSEEEDGLLYLENVFSELMRKLGIDYTAIEYLVSHKNSFFESAKKILESDDYNGIPTNIQAFRRMFKRRTGIVVNTCHGVKGEEFDLVISFGNLQGLLPNWQLIFDDDEDDQEHAKKLLYVVCSRAKRFLHLISEDGRKTKRRNSYNSTEVLSALSYDYNSDIA